MPTLCRTLDGHVKVEQCDVFHPRCWRFGRAPALPVVESDTCTEHQFHHRLPDSLCCPACILILRMNVAQSHSQAGVAKKLADHQHLVNDSVACEIMPTMQRSVASCPALSEISYGEVRAAPSNMPCVTVRFGSGLSLEWLEGKCAVAPVRPARG